MSNPFYEDMAAVAIGLLADFGVDGQLVRSAPKSAYFEKATGRELPRPGPTIIPVRAATGPQSVELVEGRTVTRATATLLVEPLRGDQLLLGARTWVVDSVKAYEGADGTAIAYEAGVSR